VFEDILSHAFRDGTSEIHIQANLPVVLFQGGELYPTEYWPASIDESDALVERLVGESRTRLLRERGWVNCGGTHRAGRFRVSAYRERDVLGARLRLFPKSVLRRGVSLPDRVGEMLVSPNGLLLVAGPTGSGVTTTLAALSQALRKDGRPVLSLEQPVEYDIPDVNQFEVGEEPIGWAEAYLSARASKSQVIAISELKTPDAAEAAIELAERGKLVLAAVPARCALDGLRHLLEGLDEQEHSERAGRLGNVIRGVVACRLVPSASAPRLIHGTLLIDSRTSDLIRERDWSGLEELLAKDEHGESLKRSLFRAVQQRLISWDDALEASPDCSMWYYSESGENH
jgi:twitching motility protein PilT